MDRLLRDIIPGEKDTALQRPVQGTENLDHRTRKGRKDSSQQSNTTSPSTRAAPKTPTGKTVYSGAEGELISATTSPAQKSPKEVNLFKTLIEDVDNLIMSSQRNRQGRGGPRGGTNDMTAERDLSDQIQSLLGGLAKGEAKAAEINQQIFDFEVRKKEAELAGIKPLVKDIDDLSQLYRAQVRLCEQQTADAEEAQSKISILKALVKSNEETAEAQPSARATTSRGSGMGDFDGPSDSPIPSPAENKQVRKGGPSRTSSQPPRSATDGPTDTRVSEPSERTSKPKVVYAKDEEVAFKRKIVGKTDEQDWILGKVVRVIGEGKSRRYDVEDLYPDDGNPGSYRTSASQMAPIPPEGSPLEDYEIGKRVLALYPDTSTFYRAEVKGMVEGGAKVQVLFEEEDPDKVKDVERRWVLDHKG